MTSPTRARTLAGAALLLLATSACGGASATTTATPAAATPTATPSAPAPPTAAPTTPAPRGPRTAADLEGLLLRLDDLPTGYAVDRTVGDEQDTGEVTSKDPACAPLVALLNSETTTGAVASAYASFDGGSTAVSFDEALDALPDAPAASAAVAAEQEAVQACDEVTVRLPELGRAAYSVSEVSVPRAGDARFGVRLTALEGDMEGFEILTVVVAVDDVVAHATFYDAYVDDVEGIIEQVVDALDGGGSTT